MKFTLTHSTLADRFPVLTLVAIFGTITLAVLAMVFGPATPRFW